MMCLFILLCYRLTRRPILDGIGDVVINVRGVAAMNNNAAKARVLYGKVESEPLQKLADGIVERFQDAGKPCRALTSSIILFNL